MNIAFYTLGCKTNQFETQAMERLFLAAGHEIVSFSTPADVYIVNTCTVTALADSKSRNAMRRAKKQSPGSVLIVCGCYAQLNAERMAELGADLQLGRDRRDQVVELAEQLAARALPGPAQAGEERFIFMPAGGLAGRTRALLKVQEGCQNYCAYCIIPYARGKCRSLPFSLALEEAERLEREGYHEIVITGIEISSYGVDLPGRPSLGELIQGICARAPYTRIRLGSLEPRTVTEDFARSLSQYPNLCPHFHLSLQSGSGRVLERMNRHYGPERYLESCRILREFFPGCAISTDLIVGFPGEEEEDFQASLDLIAAAGLSRVHLFPFSIRPGTKAAGMPDQVSKQVKKERVSRAVARCAELALAYHRQFVGRRVRVLFEEEKEGQNSGYTPEYCRVVVDGGSALHNQERKVQITDADEEALYGELAHE